MSHYRKHTASGHNDDVTSEELYARTHYDACHDDDDFESLKRRAAFSREAAGLYRQWLQAAARALANEQSLDQGIARRIVGDPHVCAGATSVSPGADTSS